MDLIKHNKLAWDKQVEAKNKWTLPVTKKQVALARKGALKMVLTPTKYVPQGWFGNVKNKKVLCLASGGGQQGPLFAAAGANVTVFDNSPKQLEKDGFVAGREGLKIELVQGDMKDLSVFENKSFDLIFNPVSNCFIDDVQPVWKECYRVLKKGGVLLSGFCNPLLFIFDFDIWDRNSKLKVKYKIPYSDLEQLPKAQLNKRIKNLLPLEYGHSLQSQIGGQLKAGFALVGLYEDSAGGDLLDKHIDTFIATKAVKL
jgi:SAM-dependent methyltransferase